MIRKKWSVLCVVLFLAATLNGCAAPAVQEGLEEAESRQQSSEQQQSSEELSSEEPQYTEEPPVSHEAQQTPAETVEAVPEEADSETDEDDPSDWMVDEVEDVQVRNPILEGLTFPERIAKCAEWSLEYGAYTTVYQFVLMDIVGDEMPEFGIQRLQRCTFFDITGDRVVPLVRIDFERGRKEDCGELCWQFFRAEYPDGKEGYIIETEGSVDTYYLWKKEKGDPFGVIKCRRYLERSESKYYSYEVYRCDDEWEGESWRPIEEARWEVEKETEEEFLARKTGKLFYKLRMLPRLEPIPATYMDDWFWFDGDVKMTGMEEYAAELLEMYMAEHGIEAD